MKHLLCYGIWNKQDMVEWLLEGVDRHTRNDVDLLFIFDNCTDDSITMYDRYVERLPNRKHIKIVSDKVLHEKGIHNKAIKYAVDNDYDVLTVYQDDQRMDNQTIDDFEAVISNFKCKSDIGIIGGRDGYNANHVEMVGSEWSESTLIKQRLKKGEFIEIPFVNSGPVCYTHDTMLTIGQLPDFMSHFYLWDFYCCLCLDKGKVNGVMGTDLTHKKFGEITDSTYYTDDNTGEKDRKALIQHFGEKYGWTNW